jgi:hypothetical protein
MKTMIKLLLSGTAAFTLIGCGSGGENWGIDAASEIEISHGELDASTGLYKCTLDDATLVDPGSVVRPIVEDTQVRVWHFQNSQEYVCVLKGQALLKKPVEGA